MNSRIAITAVSVDLGAGIQTLSAFWSCLLEKRVIQPPAEVVQSDAEAITVVTNSFRDDSLYFNPAQFGLTSAEARRIPPNHRRAIRVAARAVDESGVVGKDRTAVAVYASVGDDEYTRERVARSSGHFTHDDVVASGADYAATRISHTLDLTGPAMTVQTACSSSLSSMYLAVQELRLGRISGALVVASDFAYRYTQSYVHLKGGIASEDGYCRPYDAMASGTARGSGAVAVMLEPESHARARGATVLAYVSGIAVNNDGRRKASFAGPSAEGQASVITSALEDSCFDADRIDYVEGHGTATLLGDPIECQGIRRGYNLDNRTSGPLCLGSVKGNTGHLNSAAGLVGLAKCVAMLKSGLVPPTANFRSLNPRIAQNVSNLEVVSESRSILRSPHVLGLSSFGIGGTNGHVILESAESDQCSRGRTSDHCLAARDVENCMDHAQTAESAGITPSISTVADIPAVSSDVKSGGVNTFSETAFDLPVRTDDVSPQVEASFAVRGWSRVCEEASHLNNKLDTNRLGGRDKYPKKAAIEMEEGRLVLILDQSDLKDTAFHSLRQLDCPQIDKDLEIYIRDHIRADVGLLDPMVELFVAFARASLSRHFRSIRFFVSAPEHFRTFSRQELKSFPASSLLHVTGSGVWQRHWTTDRSKNHVAARPFELYRAGAFIIVTGDTGRVGSELVQFLLSRDCKILGIHGNAGEQRHRNYVSVRREAISGAQSNDLVAELVESWGPLDGIFHLAGAPRAIERGETFTIDDREMMFQIDAKVDSLRLLEPIVAGTKPRFLVALGSLASESSIDTLSHYAAASGMMEGVITQWSQKYGGTRFLCPIAGPLETEGQPQSDRGSVTARTLFEMLEEAAFYDSHIFVRPRPGKISSPLPAKVEVDAAPGLVVGDSIERGLSEIWREVLDVVPSSTANYFDLGGDSLSALQLAELVGSRLGLTVEASFTADNETFTEQVEYLRLMADGKAQQSAPKDVN